jgi:DNA-binding LacI/PurR family transcriptional regulator
MMTESARTRAIDVARAAGVSAATVSFVLNNTPGQTIRPETRHRVERIATEMGYTPHRAARALREGGTRIVVLKLGSLGRSSAVDSFIDGVSAEVADHGLALLIHVDRGIISPVDPVREVTPRATIDLGALYASGTPTSADGGWLDGLASHSASQIEYLLQRGHRDLAFAFRDDLPQSPMAARRRSLADSAGGRLGAGGLAPLALTSDWTESSRRLATFRAAHPHVTAVAAADDDTALLLLATMGRLGLSAPTDLAVMGFDGTPQGALWNPSLTTMRIAADIAGSNAVRRALGLDPGDGIDPAPEIVVRESA